MPRIYGVGIYVRIFGVVNSPQFTSTSPLSSIVSLHNFSGLCDDDLSHLPKKLYHEIITILV